MIRSLISAMTATAGLIALTASPVSAAPPVILGACQVINVPGTYILGNDLVAAGGICLDVQVSRVAIVMAGHTISNGGGGTKGIRIGGVGNPISRVTVRGPGRITGFRDDCGSDRGVEIGVFGGAVTQRVTVFGLLVDNNCDGISLNGSGTSDVVIENNIVFDNDREGIRLDNGTHDNVISKNEVLNNDSHGIGIGDAGTDDNTVSANNASYNTIDNIAIFGGTNNNVVDGNVALSAGLNDIEDDGTGTIVSNNTCLVGDPASACPDPFPGFALDH